MTVDTSTTIELFPPKTLVDAELIKVSELPNWVINKPN